MKTIVIDVQLAPCEMGFDIFRPSDVLYPHGNHYRDQNDCTRPYAIRYSEFPGLKQITKPTLAQLVIKVEREEGFYWVNRHGLGDESGWVVRFWDGVRFSDGKDNEWDENTYTKIDERKIERVPE